MSNQDKDPFSEIRHNLNEAAEAVIVRPSVAIGHLLFAVNELTDKVEELTSEQPSKTEEA
jgi:hypothetical protein